MADSGANPDARHLAPGRASSKGSPNVSGGWLIMVLSGLIAAVLFFFVTQQSSNRVAIATFQTNLAAGEEITENSFDRAEISAGDSQLGRLVPYEQRDQYIGWLTAGPVGAGELVQRSALREPAADEGQRSMSIPVDRTRSNNGLLTPGDLIDVIIPTENDYAATGLEVLSVETSGEGALAGNATFTLVVAVDEEQAIRVSQAISNGDFDVVKATGATTTPTTTVEGDDEDTDTTTTSTTTTTTEP
jgi:Flp pilus assembly protein CpaB